MNMADFDQFHAMVTDTVNALDDAEYALQVLQPGLLISFPDGRRERVEDLRERCIKVLKLSNRR